MHTNNNNKPRAADTTLVPGQVLSRASLRTTFEAAFVVAASAPEDHPPRTPQRCRLLTAAGVIGVIINAHSNWIVETPSEELPSGAGTLASPLVDG